MFRTNEWLTTNLIYGGMLFFFHLFMGNSVPHVIVHKDLSLIVSTALYIKK